MHALFENGIASRFADDQISPLDNHDGDEECRVTSEFQSFASFECLQTKTKIREMVITLSNSNENISKQNNKLSFDVTHS